MFLSGWEVTGKTFEAWFAEKHRRAQTPIFRVSFPASRRRETVDSLRKTIVNIAAEKQILFRKNQFGRSWKMC